MDFKKIFVLSVMSFCFAASSFELFPETVDRILAVVNGQIITMTDVRIADGFNLFEDLSRGQEKGPASKVLERMIDQTLVNLMMGENISISENEVQESLAAKEQKIGYEQFAQKLAAFGMEREDLKEYIRQGLIFKKILTQKFTYAAAVSLREIEVYYEQVYLPSQRSSGLEVQPMMEILDEIESAIKQEKIRGQVAEWVKNLRQKADIQIKSASDMDFQRNS